MDLESLSYYAFPCVTILAFLVGLAAIASLLLKRIIRACVGDQGVDIPATLALCLIAFMIFVCVGGTWVALNAPD